jgi:formimidoylglutamate deiminase
MTNTLKFEKALLADGWADAVEIEIDSAGLIGDIKTNAEPSNEFLSGCAIPGMANLHSHAHQRAMAGLAEQVGASDDSFWTWRDTMYRFIEAIQPQHLHAIAAQLYLEMLQGGYTHVAEFHYLHHQVGGRHYDNPAEMSEQLIQAAQSVGLGMTMLPVLYQQGGFGGVELGKRQRRFQHDVDGYLRLIDQLNKSYPSNSNYTTGIAAHSLRAVSIESLSEVLAALGAPSQMPVHIHIAEQQQEVSDCIAYSGVRPVQYLLDNFAVDQRWCLIHATHMDESETRRLAASGAVAGLCPTTEANLGDGFFNATSFLAQNGSIGIGSDSHISVSVSEELRWLEYGQRLLHNSRNQLAATGLRWWRTS